MKKTLMIAPLVMGVVMMGSAQTTNPTTRPTQTDVNRNTTSNSSMDTRSGSMQGNRTDTVPNRGNRPMNNTNRNNGNMGNRRDTMGMRNNGGNNRNMNNTQRNNSAMGDTAGRSNMGNMNSGDMNHSSGNTTGDMNSTTGNSTMAGGQMSSGNRWEAMGLQAGSLPRKDLKFVALAASSNSLELKASQLALQQASSQAVKDYASMMIQHHTQAATEMKAMLTSKGAMLPDSFMLDRHRTRAEMLAGMQGADFDRAYVRLMVDAHEEDVDEFEDETTDARDADLRAFATKMMPTLRMHYSRAKELRKSMR